LSPVSDLTPVPVKAFSNEDFTFYCGPKPPEAKNALCKWLAGGKEKVEIKLPNDIELALTVVDQETKTPITGRALACRTGFARAPDDAIWSVTLRRPSNLADSDKKVLGNAPNAGVDRKLRSKWKAPDDFGSTFLNSPFEVVETLADKVWGETQSKKTCAQGLLAVFGTTSSGKNWITRGFIHNYLVSDAIRNYYASVKKRRPHLITYEDPIEEQFSAADDDQTDLDYTPRQKGATAGSIKSMLRSALRQTPAALYIGETRELADWQHILRFAGTGHLVSTTAHAGSLTEAIGFLLGGLKAITPAARRDVADRLVAVVHLRAESVRAQWAGGEASDMKVMLPSVWLGTRRGRHNMMALGKGSVLPAADYCFGRYRFAKSLIDRAESRERRHRVTIEKKEKDEFLGRVLQMDLEGV
jgi:hypothetical protein